MCMMGVWTATQPCSQRMGIRSVLPAAAVWCAVHIMVSVCCSSTNWFASVMQLWVAFDIDRRG